MPMNRLLTGVIAATSVAAGAWSFGLLYEGFVARVYSSALVFPFTDTASAKRAYDALGGSAPAAAREAAAQRLIAADPANPASWSALSYAERLKDGQMSAAALAALDRSYTLSFFDRHEAIWRVGYALENWEALPPALREEVTAEAREALGDQALAPKLKLELAAIHDPAGRLAASLILAEPSPPWQDVQ
jgi:hypothetical protein